LLSISNLMVYFGAVEAVRGVSLHIEEGEVSPGGRVRLRQKRNRAGDSRTVAASASVRGRIVFDGQELTALAAASLRNTAAARSA